MGIDWHDLREQCERLDPGAELVTPLSDRRFRVETTHEDRIEIGFRDSGEELPLWREQFDALADRLDDGPVTLANLPPGVEPYATVLSVADEYVTDGDALYRGPDDAVGGESPFLIPPEEARTRPERVHDDAVLLAAVLERLDADDPSALDTGELADLYVLLSDVQRGADRLRTAVREPLLDRLGPDQQLSGRFGTVRRTTRQRRRAKDDETVLDALDEYDIPEEWVLGVDPDKLDVVIAVTDLPESDVYDVEQQEYVQKTATEEGEKYARLQGLLDRIDELDADEEAALREDLQALEERLQDALAAG